MANNYKVLHSGVDAFAQGDIIPQSHLDKNKIDVSRLIGLKAVAPVSDEEAKEAMKTQSDSGLAALGISLLAYVPPPALTTGKPQGLTEETVVNTQTQGTGTGAVQTGAAQTSVETALDDSAIAAKLKDAGFDTADKVKAATDEQLRAIPGIGPIALTKIRAMQTA